MSGTFLSFPQFGGGGGGGGGGITSINGDTTAAQVIAAGTGMAVSSAGGTTTISQSWNPTVSTLPLIDDMTAFTYPGSGSHGPLQLTFNGTYAKSTPTSTEKDKFGIASFTSTNATSTGWFSDITQMYPGGGTLTSACAFQIGSNVPTNAGNSWVATWGIGDSFPNQLNGAFFSMNYLSPNFICFTSNGGVTTQTDSGIPYAASTWYNFRVVLSPSNAKFYINGSLVATNSTNLPTTVCGAIYGAFTWQAGAGVVIRTDWVSAQFVPTSPRGTF